VRYVRLDQKAEDVFAFVSIDGGSKWSIVRQNDLVGRMLVDLNGKITGSERKNKWIDYLESFHFREMLERLGKILINDTTYNKPNGSLERTTFSV